MSNKIIIADDNLQDFGFIVDFLKIDYPHYILEVYENTEELEKRFEQGFEGVKVVVLDEVMGKFSSSKRGTDLIKKYSPLAKKCGCEMVLHTGEYESQGPLAIEYGAIAYIPKPATFPFVEELFKKLLK